MWRNILFILILYFYRWTILYPYYNLLCASYNLFICFLFKKIYAFFSENLLSKYFRINLLLTLFYFIFCSLLKANVYWIYIFFLLELFLCIVFFQWTHKNISIEEHLTWCKNNWFISTFLCEHNFSFKVHEYSTRKMCDICLENT